MTMISYAQNREDVLVRRLFPELRSGCYIDVGAGDPTTHSITRYFYDLGWRGINIEPRIASMHRLRAERSEDVNLNVGLSNRPGSLTFFETVNPAAGELSTFCPDLADLHSTWHAFTERTVEVATLAEVCARHVNDRQIDFLSVDVEGHEFQVLEGGDWRRWRPRLLIIEATRPTTSLPTHEQWEEILLAADYLFAAFDGINRYYLRVEDRDLLPRLSTPANFLDDYLPFEVTQRALFARIHSLEDEREQSRRAFAVHQAALEKTRQEMDLLWNKLESAEKLLALTRPEPVSALPPQPRFTSFSHSSTALHFNKACEMEDFADPEIVELVRQCPWLPIAHHTPDYPKGWEHARDWEVAMTLRTLRHFGALRPDATLLGVSAGNDLSLFFLSNYVKRVFATDRYLAEATPLTDAPLSMLLDPEPALDKHFRFDSNRLVIQHMDNGRLRYPDDTFDGIFASSSLAELGELSEVAQTAYEIGRVLKPSGVLSLATVVPLQASSGTRAGFLTEQLQKYIVEASGLELVDELHTEVSEATLATRQDMSALVTWQDQMMHANGYEHLGSQPPAYLPALVFDHAPLVFVSVHLALRKTTRYPMTDNGWARPLAA